MSGWHARTQKRTGLDTSEVSGVSRRTLTRSAAWATPVLVTSVAAPAMAVSGPCTDFGTTPMPTAGKVFFLAFQPSGLQVSFDFTAQRANGTAMTLPGDTGFTALTDYNTAANPQWRYIILRHRDTGAQVVQQGDKIIMTMTFNAFVKNATLQITDIDRDVNSWIDHVTISPAGYTATKVGTASQPSHVTGAGTLGDPFRSDADLQIQNFQGDLILKWTDPLKQIVITYTAADAQNASTAGQHIGIGKFGYNNC